MPEPENADAERPIDLSAESTDSHDRADAPAEPSAPLIADAELLQSVDLARVALLEITAESTIGEPAGHSVESEHALSLRFENLMAGYPGWYWTVTVGRAPGEAPTVLEAELMPGENALTAPDWIPWSDRLADYRTAQQTAASEGSDDEESDDEHDDEHDDDSDDYDDEAYDDDLDVDVFGETDSAAPAASELDDDESDDSEDDSDETDA